MAVGDQTEQSYLPKKKKSETEDDKRMKNIVPGSLLKAVVRPGGGDSSPVDGDQFKMKLKNALCREGLSIGEKEEHEIKGECPYECPYSHPYECPYNRGNGAMGAIGVRCVAAAL